ncbi:MAG: NAD(P)/FAD-dependent oxidoreductase [Bacteroidota bacterium]
MDNPYICIPETELPRIVVVGGGFAGYNFIKKISDKQYQIVLLDKTNYHRFQPLLYQVATCGLESDSISFPLRKLFHKRKNLIYRNAALEKVIPEKQKIITDKGMLKYDILIMAMGSKPNFYGMQDAQQNSFPLKDIIDALNIRNKILISLENASNSCDNQIKETYTHFIVVGGGPTGVEMAGSLAEFKNYILKKDYPDQTEPYMKIYLIEMQPRLLPALSESASKKAENQLKRMGVEVITKASVKHYDGLKALLNDGTEINAATLIWTAGVAGNSPFGFKKEVISKNEQIKVNEYNKVDGYEDIYAIGDMANMAGKKNPKGHPMLARIAIEQAKHLAKNLKRIEKGKSAKPFIYQNNIFITTIGKKYAVADIGRYFLKGFVAWIAWATIHLYSLVGGKNKIIVGINWLYHYFTYDKTNRYILKGLK